MNAMHRGFRWLAVVGVTLATVVLSGCATSRNVESEVRSFGGATPILAGASYRFERLPSQSPQSVEPLELAAQKVLTAKGLVRSDAQASYSVQVRLDADALQPDALQHWANTPFPDRVVVAPDGSVWRQVRRPLLDPTWYRHSLQVVVRELASGSVAYETRAVHESPWSDTPNLIAPLMEAALGDFPQAQPAPKTIAIELPASSARKP
jgi:hypothetical protein